MIDGEGAGEKVSAEKVSAEMSGRRSVGVSVRIAVVAGDGIGPEVVGAGAQGARRGAARRRDDRVRPRRGPLPRAPARCCPTPCWTSSPATTRSCSARSATRPCRRACWSAACCSSCGSRSTSTSTCARRGCGPARPAPLATVKPGEIDFVVVREGTEGLYAGAGGTLHRGTPAEVATEESLNTRHGVERVIRDAFARARPGASGARSRWSTRPTC